MEKTTHDEQLRRPLLRRSYIIIFFIAFIILICGFTVISNALFTPRPSPSDPHANADYLSLMKNSSTLSKLLIEIGLSLFSVSSFLGAIIDPDIADTVKRGMMVASGISLLGVVIVFISPGIYVF